ncbi:hypothetical protein Q7A53_10010 [Halobacillus rhizosphaerae]|uniref:hypothetical protein n=1 Tax=Halobacillus rhizosphaerae TaxID=3064889 RepID=UPI00398A6FB6
MLQRVKELLFLIGFIGLAAALLGGGSTNVTQMEKTNHVETSSIPTLPGDLGEGHESLEKLFQAAKEWRSDHSPSENHTSIF